MILLRAHSVHTRFTISTEKGDDMSVLFLRRCDAATMDMFMFARSDHFAVLVYIFRDREQ